MLRAAKRVLQRWLSSGRWLRSSYLWLIVSGYLVRIALMPVTGQHDVMFMAWQANFVTQGHLHVYEYLYEQFGEAVMSHPAVWAPYPYGYYVFTSLWVTLIKGLGLVDLAQWQGIWEVTRPARVVFLLKLAYLPFDVLIGYVLYRAGGRIGGTLSWALWSWSPTAVYTPFMMGQNDVYATALTVAGLYAASRSISGQQTPFPKKGLATPWRGGAWVSILLLGIGATFKTFPLLLVPVVALLLTPRWVQQLKLSAAGVAIFALCALPFATSAAFREGVLLNEEGLRLFQESSVLGFPVPLFIAGYFFLAAYVIADSRASLPSDAWSAGLIVFALLFLLVPTPLYWLIWITPLIIFQIGRGKRALLVAWLLLQLGFSVLLLSQHRELGVALPVHLSGEFSVPNLADATALSHPLLNQFLQAVWPVSRGAVAAGLGVCLWRAFASLRKPKHRTQTTPIACVPLLVIGPAVLLFLGLTTNLVLAGRMVSEANWLSWDTLVLTEERPTITQTIMPEVSPVTGVRLRVQQASPGNAQLRACLLEGDLSDGHQVACASRQASKTSEGGFVYVLFDPPYTLSPDERRYAIEVHLKTSGATVTLPYSTQPSDSRLSASDREFAGSLDVSLLHPFSPLRAARSLIVDNVWRDRVLVGLMVMASIVTTLGIARLWLGQEDIAAFGREGVSGSHPPTRR